MKKILMAIPALVLSGACSKKVATPAEECDDSRQAQTVTIALDKSRVGFRDSKPVNALPKATAFRMSGDYADHVAIRVSDDGQLIYYPAPTDITSNSAPMDLGDGWWLNRQGIGEGYQFTRYTFKEYAALKETPSHKELLESLIPGAKVTEIRKLPYTASEAMQHLPEIKALLSK